MKRQRDGKKRGERWWRKLIEKQAATGERVVAVCERAGVTPWAFYWWRQRLQGKAKAEFTQVELGVVNEYEVRCRNGRSVVLRGAVSPAVLASILSVVEGEGR